MNRVLLLNACPILFILMLYRLNRKCKDNSQVISQGGMDFVSTLVKLLDRLFDFRNMTDNTGEASQDLKMHVMYNLLVS